MFQEILNTNDGFKEQFVLLKYSNRPKKTEKTELTKSNLLFDETQFFYQERAVTLNFEEYILGKFSQQVNRKFFSRLWHFNHFQIDQMD